MGREIKRVALDFVFPLGTSYSEATWTQHESVCRKRNHDKCEINREPPKGDGWQLWQTVSDGPISPVFETAEKLIAFMCQPAPVDQRPHHAPEAYPDNPWAQGWRRETAESFVKREGWVPSMIVVNGQPLSATATERHLTERPGKS